VQRARRLERFLSQPFFVAEAFTGQEGRYVSVEDTVRSFKEIVEGEHDDLPERAFYMKGSIDEVSEERKSGGKKKRDDDKEEEGDEEEASAEAEDDDEAEGEDEDEAREDEEDEDDEEEEKG